MDAQSRRVPARGKARTTNIRPPQYAFELCRKRKSRSVPAQRDELGDERSGSKPSRGVTMLVKRIRPARLRKRSRAVIFAPKILNKRISNFEKAITFHHIFADNPSIQTKRHKKSQTVENW
jgi:hypothetical protein